MNEESSDFFKTECSRLPMRGAKSDSTELRWVSMNPSDWLENLEAKANSLKTPTPDGSPNRSGTESFATSTPALSTTTPWDEKRYHQAPYMEALPLDMELLMATIDHTSNPSSWNLQSLHPTPLVDRTRKLVIAIEAQSNFQDLKPLLEQIRDHFTSGVSQAKSLPQKQALDQFDILCIKTIKKLQSLLAQAMSIQFPQECSSHVISTGATTSMDHDGIHHSPTNSVNRAAFHSHMNNWLRANWINPYPDEAVSHQLAYETGENVHVVNTWLVNARSRRWRPAVLRAFELGRPSEYLLEDSINLFEDRPLRAIQGRDISSEGSNKRARIN